MLLPSTSVCSQDKWIQFATWFSTLAYGVCFATPSGAIEKVYHILVGIKSYSSLLSRIPARKASDGMTGKHYSVHPVQAIVIDSILATNPNTITTWAKSQRKGWLCLLYGEDITEDLRRLHPESKQSQLVAVLEDLLSGTSTLHEAVERTQPLVLADPATLFANFTGVYFSAVLFFAGKATTKVLVDYIVALGSLPDAVNAGPDPMVIDLGGDRVYSIAPGEVIDPGDGKLWRTLPGFNMYIVEEFQGACVHFQPSLLSCHELTDALAQDPKPTSPISANQRHLKLRKTSGGTSTLGWY
jgi:hypothetical protein